MKNEKPRVIHYMPPRQHGMAACGTKTGLKTRITYLKCRVTCPECLSAIEKGKIRRVR